MRKPDKMTDKAIDCHEILENVPETQELKVILRFSLRPVSQEIQEGLYPYYCLTI